MSLQKLPIGIQSFEDLRNRNFLYIDKTSHIYKLITEGKVYFLSRPRRFGKSLTISTLEAIFKAKKELFEGLWIKEKSDYNWQEYPVIRLDFAGTPSKTHEEFETKLAHRLITIAKSYGLELEKNYPTIMLETLIQELKNKFQQNVVVLVDEYDKPIIDHLSRIEIAKRNRDFLKVFYEVLKSQDENLHFILLTGVSKFSKVTVFSGLNNLNDISMSSNYADIVGYTQEELETNFSEHIDVTTEALGMNRDELMKEIARWYNGYKLTRSNIKVYNPFSTLHLFSEKEFSNYWFASGTSQLLIDVIETQNPKVEALEHFRVGPEAFDTFNIEKLNIESLFFQTGYLTIGNYDSQSNLYTLTYPNYEVKNSFLKQLFSHFSKTNVGFIEANYVFDVIEALTINDLEKFLEIMRGLFAEIPYEIQLKHEYYYQSLFYMICTFIGFRTQAEVHTNQGSIDMIVETQSHIHVFEFKLNGTAQEALNQIKEKKYYEKYLKKAKKVTLIGLEFNIDENNHNKRNIGEFMLEELE